MPGYTSTVVKQVYSRPEDYAREVLEMSEFAHAKCNWVLQGLMFRLGNLTAASLHVELEVRADVRRCPKVSVPAMQ